MLVSFAMKICLFRLSALGDVVHALALVRRIQTHWPDAQITWVIGKFEHKLVGDVAGVNFVPVDKKQGWAARKQLAAQMAGQEFDALLLCQIAFRAGMLASVIRARRRIGYDWGRSKELHSWFIRERIAAPTHFQHVHELLQSFADALSVPAAPTRWDLPIPDEAHAFAAEHLPGTQPTLIISPCSSHRLRNWHPGGYAALAAHAVSRYGLRVALCGGPSAIEREMADAIKGQCPVALVDLVGKDTLKRAMALMQRSIAVLTPDSGPMHIANALGVPVLGLHAASDARRSGAYGNLRYTVDCFPAACEKYLHKAHADTPWGTKIEYEGVMDLIPIPAVIEKLDLLMADRAAANQS